MQKHTIVFDFDGTIANSITIGLKVVNSIIAGLGMDEITENNFEIIRGKPYYDIIKMINIPIWQIPKLLLQLRDKMKENLHDVHPYRYMPYVLTELQKEGYRLFVLTSNSRDIVEDFMRAHAIEVFEDIYSEKNIFGKAAAITQLLKLQGIQKNDVVYIGDEVRDIEASKKAGIPVISVTWGFNSEDILKSHSPSAIAHEPKELLSIVRDLTR